MAFTQSLRWLLMSVIKTTLKDNTKTEEGWEWEEVRGISGGHPSLSIPAKWRGGHWSADKYSQATVFSVQSIDRGLVIPQEPFIVHEHLIQYTSASFHVVPVCVWRLRIAHFNWISVVQQECDGVVKKKKMEKILGFFLWRFFPPLSFLKTADFFYPNF